MRTHRSYEKIAFRIFRKSFRRIASKIPFDSLNEQNYEALVNIAISEQLITFAYVDVYTEIGLIHGKRIGKVINRELKEFNLFTFENEFQRGIYKWVVENVGYRIRSVNQEFRKYIVKAISDGIEEGRTIRQIAADMQKLIKSRGFYRFQTLRIARTETTAAANRGAIQAGENSRIVYEKIWVTALDERVRKSPFNHAAMNGVKVSKNEYFDVQGEKLEYPGAPETNTGAQSSGSNVINCRCTTALVPKRDANGRLVRI